MTDPVDEALDRLALDCLAVEADIDAIGRLLASGNGSPLPYEMTPAQSERFVAIMAPVGITGGNLLALDLLRTAERESDELDD